MGLDFSVIPDYLDIVLWGALWTVAITVGAAIVSFFGGIVFAVIALYAHLIVRLPFRAFAFLFMGTPLLLQLFLIYFGLVQIGIDLPAFVAGIIGLGLHFAVYNSELIQTAILSVDKGQMEAARTLGLSQWQAMYKIILPQAARLMVRPLGVNLNMLIKATALVAAISVVELTYTAQRYIGSTYKPFEMFLLAGILYMIIIYATGRGVAWLDRKVQIN